MKFYGRKKELEILQLNEIQSKKTACFTVMVGRRRIGKTSLLLESVKNQKYLYLFVSRKNEQLLCMQFQKEAEEALGLQIFGSITAFQDIFEQLLIYSIKQNYTLIIDEFQELEYVNASIFSDIQRLWDKYKDQAKLNFIACGSNYLMMLKIFEDKKEPLFGRLTSKMVLQPFPVGLMLEKYFREKLSESERITAIGSYWDDKGGNEIDLIAINDLDRTGIVAEVKRNPKKINIELLKVKAKSIQKELGKYDMEVVGFSMKDM